MYDGVNIACLLLPLYPESKNDDGEDLENTLNVMALFHPWCIGR
jgi:hypothetical protein